MKFRIIAAIVFAVVLLLAYVLVLTPSKAQPAAQPDYSIH